MQPWKQIYTLFLTLFIALFGIACEEKKAPNPKPTESADGTDQVSKDPKDDEGSGEEEPTEDPSIPAPTDLTLTHDLAWDPEAKTCQGTVEVTWAISDDSYPVITLSGTEEITDDATPFALKEQAENIFQQELTLKEGEKRFVFIHAVLMEDEGKVSETLAFEDPVVCGPSNRDQPKDQPKDEPKEPTLEIKKDDEKIHIHTHIEDRRKFFAFVSEEKLAQDTQFCELSDLKEVRMVAIMGTGKKNGHLAYQIEEAPYFIYILAEQTQEDQRTCSLLETFEIKKQDVPAT